METNTTRIIRYLVTVLAIAETVLLLLTNRSMRTGLDGCMWLLPFTVFMCLVLRGNVFCYHQGGIALKVYYVIVFVRYMLLPFTIYLSYGATGYYMPAVNYASSYWIAVVVMCIELIVSVGFISYYYPIYLEKAEEESENEAKYPSNTLSLTGVLLIAFLVLILIIRRNYVIPSMNIILIKDAAEDSGVWYEAIILNCLKAIAYAYFMQHIKNNFEEKNKAVYYVLSIILALLNFGVYFGSNRAYIFQTLIATLVIYLYVYPEHKTATMIVLVPIGAICVATMFVNKQFGMEVGDFTVDILDAKTVSNIIELYVGGPWNYASGWESTVGRYLPDIEMTIASFIQKFALVNIPGFKWLRYIEYSMTSLYGGDVYAWDAYQATMGAQGNSQILSGVMEIIMMWGRVLGVLISFIYQVWVTRMLVKMECLGKKLKNIKYRYYYVWLGVVFGMYMCYSPALLLWVWSKFALFYWLFLMANDRIKLVIKS